MQMDVCSHISFPVNDVNNLHFCMNTTLVGNFSMDELAYKATEFLNIQDDIKEGVSGSIPPHEEGDLQKLVSAMKGSREKRGGGVSPAKQLTVKWAPDVYDPVVPCSAVVIVVKRPHKKNGKSNKEKNNGGKRGKGKDKKQSRKRGGELF